MHSRIFFSLCLNFIHQAIFKCRKETLFLKAEIPDILLVSEGIFREWTRATGLCLPFCPHSASFHQTYFMLFCSCALSQPVIGTDKSVVLGLFFLIFLFHLIKTCAWLCLLTLDSSWRLLWELLENLLLVLCCVLSDCFLCSHVK